MSFFSFLSSLVFPQIERERERGYIVGYREKQSQSLLILFRWIPVENISSFTGKDFVLFSPGLKVWLLLVQDTFRLPLPVVLALDSFSTTCVQRTDFLIPYFR